MAFDPRIVEAKLVLKMIHPEELPDIAVEAMQAGFDGPTICEMAFLVRPSGYTTDLLLGRFMAETGLSRIEVPTAALRLAQHLARSILANNEDPLLFTRQFEQLWIATDYAPSIQELGTLDDDVYISFADNSTKARGFVRDVLKEFADRPDAP
jgi:hypothetical protein